MKYGFVFKIAKYTVGVSSFGTCAYYFHKNDYELSSMGIARVGRALSVVTSTFERFVFCFSFRFKCFYSREL